MRTRVVLWFLALALILGAAACEKLPPPPSMARGELKTEDISTVDAIPLDYGALVGVTPFPEIPYTTGLWFEKADKTIVLVKVNIALGKIEKKALVLPRR